MAWLKKSNSGGSKSVPRRQRNVRKSSVFGRSPLWTAGKEETEEEELEEPPVSALIAVARVLT